MVKYLVALLLAVSCIFPLAGSVKAGGLDDLKSGKVAAENNKGDDAIRLFSQALAASDLAPADRADALKRRGAEYSVKALIAAAYRRPADSRSERDKAIADFSAAIDLNAGDSEAYVTRGQERSLDGHYDQAIADFDAALKLKNSAATLIQRGASYRAKGGYDRAVADFTAALAGNDKDAALDASEIYNERGYTEFIAARYDAAAADFAQALTLGLPARIDDVLWLPYQAAWLHITHARAGQNDNEELTRNASKINLKQWPGTLIAFFLGQVKQDQLTPPSNHGSMGRARECNVSFFLGEKTMVKGDRAEAARLFRRVRDVCNINTVQFLAAGVELKRLAN